MSTIISTRRKMIEQRKAIEDDTRLEADDLEQVDSEECAGEKRRVARNNLINSLCKSLRINLMIPIIGDTVRNEKIFDIDYNKMLGLAAKGAEPTKNTALTEAGETDQISRPLVAEKSSGIPILPQRELSITEQLAVLWASEINYPLVDSYRIARVAQYLAVNKSQYVAKEEYLSFQKRRLLNEAKDAAEREEDEQEREKAQSRVRHLEGIVDYKTFPEIVGLLGLPRFNDGEEDPIDLLARLPIRYYVTTGYYDFVEKALEENEKKPRTRLCLRKLKPSDLKEEHRPLVGWEPTIREPMVYHLFGLAEYPESMVLSEDDYIEFLMELSKMPADDSANRFIAAYVEAALKSSALLLLGYRLHDWDFRVLFRVLKTIAGKDERQRPAIAIQLDPENQFEIVRDTNAVDKATNYLKKYFEQVELTVNWDRTDEFITELWGFWNAIQGGG